MSIRKGFTKLGSHPRDTTTITRVSRIIGAASLVFVAASLAAQGTGALPAYPGTHAIPPSAATSIHLRGATALVASGDSLQKVDGWFKAHASRCARILLYNLPNFDEAHADIRYACQEGSITLHADNGGTQIAYVVSGPSTDGH